MSAFSFLFASGRAIREHHRVECDDFRDRAATHSSEFVEHAAICRPCSDWDQARVVRARGFDPLSFPCVHLAYRITASCAAHPDPADCPDAVVLYSAKFDEYELPVRDGGTSGVQISNCPWCGVPLPESKRDRWFETLEKMGFDNPATQAIPPEFTSGEWWRSVG